MRAGKSLAMAYFSALGSNSASINSLIFLGLGFLVCKMGQRCPLSKLGGRVNQAVDVAGLEHLLFTIFPSQHVAAWPAASHHPGIS